MEWFYYNDVDPVFDPESYYPIFVPTNCIALPRLCAIRAFRQYINGLPRPILTPALQAQITAATTTGTPSATVLLKP